MKLEGNYPIKAPREKVWMLLTDPVVLCRCIPGCQKLDAVGEDVYHATLMVGLASIKGVYTGSVKIVDKTPPSHHKMLIEGKGPQGFVKGEGGIALQEQSGETLVSYTGDIQVGGTIASVGQRMLQSSAKMMANQFFTAIAAEAAAAPDDPPKQGMLINLFRYLWGLIRRAFAK